MAGERTFIVRFLADTANAIKGIKGLSGEIGGLGKSTGGIFESFNAVSLAATAAFAGLGAMAAKSVSAAIDDAKEQELLALTLRNVTNATDEVIAKNEEMIAGFARTTTFSDSMLRPALAALVQGSGSLATAQRDITLAMDIATATQMPLSDVASALAKGYNDQFKALKSLSPSLNDNIKAGQTLDQVFAELNDRFGGAAAAAAGTTAGQMAILKNQMGELSESIGAALVPILETLLPLFQSVADFAMKHNTLFKFLIITIGGLTAAYLGYNLALKLQPIYLAAVTAAQYLLNIAMTANPIGLFIVAVASLSVAFLYLTDNMEPLINAWNHLANGMGRLLNLIPGVNVTLIDTSGTVDKVNTALYPMPSTLEQTAQGWRDVAGACVEFMKVSPEKIIFDQGYRLNKMAKELYGATITYGGFNKSVGGTAKTVQTATEKLKEYTDGLKANNSAKKAYNNAQKDSIKAGESLTEANLNLTDAQNKFNAAVAGFGADSPQARKAAHDLAVSERDLERANYGVEKSIKDVQDAEENLAAVRAKKGADPRDIREAEIGVARAKQDQAKSILDIADAEKELQKVRRRRRSSPEDLLKAETGLTNAKFNVEEAVFAVTDAEKKLSDLRLMKGATPEEIRDAEIGLAEAKLSVADATDAQTDATDSLTKKQDLLNEAISGALTDSETYKTLSDELKDAKLRQRDATDGVTEAIERESDALVRYREAYANAVALTLKFPKIAANNPLGGFAGSIPQTVTGNAAFTYPSGQGSQGASIIVNAGVVASEAEVADLIGDLLARRARLNGGNAYATY